MTSSAVTAKPFKIPESVLVVIYTAEMNVLMMRRADVGDLVFWQSVTGSKDTEDEAFADTAAREVQEETGIACGPGTCLHTQLRDWQLENRYAIYPRWRHRYAPGVVHNTERLFGLLVPHDVTVRLHPREHSAYCWLPMLRAADLCYSPSNAEAILLLPRFAGTSK